MARLSLSFLGAFRATLDGVTLSGFKSNKVRALLAYLAVELTRPHSRQSLAGLLWPELPDQAAGAALRNALSNLHHLLPDLPSGDSQPFLLVTREAIQFNPRADYWLDVQAFSDQLSVTGDQQSSISALQTAVDLFQGDFLAGFFVADSIPFEEWLLLCSEAYHSQAVTAMQQLGELLIEQGNFRQAQQIARRQLELEPYSETGYRQLIHSLASSGQRSEALLQFSTLRRLLADELEACPEQETIELYETIRSGVTASAGSFSMKPEPPPNLPGQPGLFARADQLLLLNKYLTEALSCQGRVAFITGEPGSGKTTLLAKFSQSAMQQYPGLVAAFGGCAARSGLCSPYLPFVDILSMLSGDIE
ncbi:MAG: putative Transcriptional regulator, family, partial [Chloroflexi bacterium]|nr:putative Transcriptional regulator, family [Chloroflexota bacterium]